MTSFDDLLGATPDEQRRLVSAAIAEAAIDHVGEAAAAALAGGKLSADERDRVVALLPLFADEVSTCDLAATLWMHIGMSFSDDSDHRAAAESFDALARAFAYAPDRVDVHHAIEAFAARRGALAKYDVASARDWLARQVRDGNVTAGHLSRFDDATAAKLPPQQPEAVAWIAGWLEGLSPRSLEAALPKLWARESWLATQLPEETWNDALRRTRHSVLETADWDDRTLGAKALRWCLEVSRGDDADTPTSLLAKALRLDPTRDDLLVEYVVEVADSSYRYTDLYLADVAAATNEPDRKRRLMMADAAAAYFVLASYLDPPGNPTYEAVLRKAFTRAAVGGGTPENWDEFRAWLIARAQEIARAPDIDALLPRDVFRRFT